MKKITLLLIVFLASIKSYATHNKAGEITFVHLSGLQYEVTIKTYTKLSAPADRPYLPIFWGDGTSDSLARSNGNGVIVAFDIKENIYTGVHSYPGNGSYIIYLEDPNRNGGIINIPGSVTVPFYIETQLVINPLQGIMNSPQFAAMPIMEAMVNTPYVHNVTAFDPDGDALSYELIPCRGAGGNPVPGYYIPANFSIDSLNGEITWFNPTTIGEFSFAVKINKWRNGVPAGYVVRDFVIDVLPPSPVNFNFSGNSNWNVDAHGNYSYAIYAGDSIDLDLNFTDSTADNLEMEAYSDAFTGANPPVYLKTPSIPVAYSEFKWVTNVSNVRSSPYVITFRGMTDHSGTAYYTDVTLMICVYDNTTSPCLTITSKNEIEPDNIPFHIYPNPFTGKFFITGVEEKNDCNLVIYDLAGRIVKNVPLTISTNEIDASDLTDGFFTFEIRNSTSVLTKGKLIKE
jgi:hypothetical protein